MEEEVKIKPEKLFGHTVKSKQEFYAEGTFNSLDMAQTWLSANGYSYGSLCREMPVGIIKGKYTMNQKWKNFDKEDMQLMDGIIISDDFREGTVTVILFDK